MLVHDRRRAFSVVLALIASLLSAVVAKPASAAVPHEVPGLYNIADIVVDELHGQMFVGQGSSATSIIVLGQNGAVVDTISGTEVWDLALSEDSSTLYAAVAGVSVLAIDTVTHEVEQTHDVCAEPCVQSMAVSDGLVWFGSGGYDVGSISALDPTDGSVHLDLFDTGQSPHLMSSPARPGELFAWTLNANRLYALDVAGGATPTVTQRASRWIESTNLFRFDMAITADGSTLVPAARERTMFLDPETLATQSRGPSTWLAEVAIRSDGLVAAYSMIDSYEIQVFRVRSSSRLNSYEFYQPVDHGVEFLRGKLFIFEESDGVVLTILNPRERTKISMSLGTKVGVAGRGIPVTVRGPAGRQIRIDTEGQGPAVTKRIPANGVLKTKVRLDHNGCIAATSLADATHDASERVGKCLKVRVAFKNRMRAPIAKRGGFYLYKIRDAAVLQTKVVPRKKTCVFFRAQFLVGGKWGRDVRTRCLKLDGRGTARVGLSGEGLLGIPARLRSEYEQDDRNMGNTSPWMQVKFVR